jgi:predicted RNA-binding Zn-ribbon protein involved in translation (DUF1610 family)
MMKKEHKSSILVDYDYDKPIQMSCPNCKKGVLKRSRLVKSTHQLKYLYFLYCVNCGFSWLRKIGVTKSGRVREWELTTGEANRYKFAIVGRDGSIRLAKY